MADLGEHREQIPRGGVAEPAQHPHEAFGIFFEQISERLESKRGIDHAPQQAACEIRVVAQQRPRTFQEHTLAKGAVRLQPPVNDGRQLPVQSAQGGRDVFPRGAEGDLDVTLHTDGAGIDAECRAFVLGACDAEPLKLPDRFESADHSCGWGMREVVEPVCQ